MKNIGFPECSKACPEVIGKLEEIEWWNNECLDQAEKIMILKRRNAILANALLKISQWEFDIMGDCVKDATDLANKALREEYDFAIPRK
jgi:hypothetical protein